MMKNADTLNPRPVPQETPTTEELVLYICKGFSGEIARVVVNSGLTLEEAIPEIADRINYFSPDWEKIGLYNLTRDFEYQEGIRLEETRTMNGDLVMMADGAACHKD